MKINICMKSAGSRKPVLDKVPYEISNDINTVEELIKEIVYIEVKKYNAKGTGQQLVAFLTGEELEEQVMRGKVGFGRIYSGKKADLEKSVKTALDAYKDGIVRIFQNEEELIGTDTEITINENDSFTFMKFVFLAGRMW